MTHDRDAGTDVDGDSDDSDEDEIPRASRPESSSSSSSWLGDLIQAGISLFTSTIDEDDGSINSNPTSPFGTPPRDQTAAGPGGEQGGQRGRAGESSNGVGGGGGGVASIGLSPTHPAPLSPTHPVPLSPTHPVLVASDKLVNGIISRDEYEHIATVHAMMDEVSSPGNKSPVRGGSPRRRRRSSIQRVGIGSGGSNATTGAGTGSGFREAIFHVPADVASATAAAAAGVSVGVGGAVVGISVELDGPDCVVQEVERGSWAADAGFRIGDAIDSVAGVSMKGWTAADVHGALMRGGGGGGGSGGGNGIAPVAYPLPGSSGDAGFDIAVFLRPSTTSGIAEVEQAASMRPKPGTPMFLTLDVSRTDGNLDFAFKVRTVREFSISLRLFVRVCERACVRAYVCRCPSSAFTLLAYTCTAHAHTRSHALKRRHHLTSVQIADACNSNDFVNF